jgi:hypothetical protein
MSRVKWTAEEDTLLVLHAEEGAPAASRTAFWSQAVVPGRQAASIVHRAQVRNLKARLLPPVPKVTKPDGRRPWLPQDDALMRQHAKTGKEANSVKEFWAQLYLYFPGRTITAICHRANALHLWAKHKHNSTSAVCPCGIVFAKRLNSYKTREDTAHLCQTCVRKQFMAKHKHRRDCVSCGNEFRGGRRQRICPSCKERGIKRTSQPVSPLRLRK